MSKKDNFGRAPKRSRRKDNFAKALKRDRKFAAAPKKKARGDWGKGANKGDWGKRSEKKNEEGFTRRVSSSGGFLGRLIRKSKQARRISDYWAARDAFYEQQRRNVGETRALVDKRNYEWQAALKAYQGFEATPDQVAALSEYFSGEGALDNNKSLVATAARILQGSFREKNKNRAVNEVSGMLAAVSGGSITPEQKEQVAALVGGDKDNILKGLTNLFVNSYAQRKQGEAAEAGKGIGDVVNFIGGLMSKVMPK